jgi:Phosphatidylinositol-4-phosphate 5-Kinase
LIFLYLFSPFFYKDHEQYSYRFHDNNEYLIENKEKRGPILNKQSIDSLKGESWHDIEDIEAEIEKMQPFNMLGSSMSVLDSTDDQPNSYFNEVILCHESQRILSEVTRLKNLLKKLVLKKEEIDSQGLKYQKSFCTNKTLINNAPIDTKTILNKSTSMPIYVNNSALNERRATLRNIPNQTLNSVRKQISIYFGHPNWNLILNMMVGIRAAVKKIYRHGTQLEDQDFKIKSVFEIIDKRSKEFDKTKSCRFYDYAPKVFEKLRKIFGIENEFYLRSVGPEQLLGDIIMGNLSSLTQFCSSGKSGSLFYYSFNGRFILKTISQNEFFFFRQILKNYYHYFNKTENSLITKYLIKFSCFLYL